MIIQLIRDDQDIIATDGQMYVDGRTTINSIFKEVEARNARFAKNFPHKIATAFKYKGATIKLIK